MKFRSLFLATLAVMAMASCSNENDPITDNGNGEKNAIFNFSIALPNNGTTKADGNEAGTLKEQKVNNITLVLTYEGGIPVFTKTYQVNEFTQSGSIYTLTNAEQVSAGTATATIYVNNNGVPGNTTVETAVATGLGDYASTEGSGNFFMSGVSTSFSITANTLNTAPTVQVDRIAVKLDECTDTDGDADGKQTVFNVTAENSLVKKALTIQLTDYAYSNLNKKSNALASTKYYAASDFFNPFIEDQEVTTPDLWTTTFQNATNTIDKDVTYCFENGATAPTKIYYKATVTLDGVTAGTTFYVDTNNNNELYTSFTDLNAAYNNALGTAYNLTEDSSNTDFMKEIGVRKYTSGICYYGAPIEEAGITRNNWYKLKVISIADLGLPEIDTPIPGAPTLLVFSVEVNQWNVWNKEIQL